MPFTLTLAGYSVRVNRRPSTHPFHPQNKLFNENIPHGNVALVRVLVLVFFCCSAKTFLIYSFCVCVKRRNRKKLKLKCIKPEAWQGLATSSSGSQFKLANLCAV